MRIVLQACQWRTTRLVPLKDTAPLTFEDWKSYIDCCGGARTDAGLRNLRAVTVGSFIGLLASGSNCVLVNADKSNDFGWVLKKQPRLCEISTRAYRVDLVDWGAIGFERS